jgi:hypothetical protein
MKKWKIKYKLLFWIFIISTLITFVFGAIGDMYGIQNFIFIQLFKISFVIFMISGLLGLIAFSFYMINED